MTPATQIGALPDKEAVTPSVSVAVPSYNHEPFIRQCLTSIFRQTLAPLELIVIDDCSTDDSLQVIEKTLKDCPFPSELYTRENKGLCLTLNEGLERSKGEFFAYLGSDDIWLPEFLQARIGALEQDPSAVLAYGHCYIIDEENRIIGESEKVGIYEYPNARDRLLYGFTPTSCTVAYRKRSLGEHRWNPEIRLEDYDLYLRLCGEGDFIFDPRILSAWRSHGYNTSRDEEFMVREIVGAIARNADALGLDENELKLVTSRRTIPLIDRYLAEGKRKEAVKLFIGNLRGFPSAGRIFKKAMKLMLPSRLNSMRGGQPEQPKGFINEDFEIELV